MSSRLGSCSDQLLAELPLADPGPASSPLPAISGSPKWRSVGGLDFIAKLVKEMARSLAVES